MSDPSEPRADEREPLHRAPRAVRFQDIDAAGIVFFARVFDWFHDAYVDALRARGLELARVLEAGAWAAPLVHAEADYRAPMRFGDEVLVEVVRAELGATSVTVHYRLRSAAKPARVHAVGKTVHVVVEREQFRPITPPDELREALALG